MVRLPLNIRECLYIEGVTAGIQAKEMKSVPGFTGTQQRLLKLELLAAGDIFERGLPGIEYHLFLPLIGVEAGDQLGGH